MKKADYEMNDEYFEDLADYIMGHGTSGGGKSFAMNKIISDLPPDVQENIRETEKRKREDFIERLKTDKKFRKECEDRKRNLENMKCFFGRN